MNRVRRYWWAALSALNIGLLVAFALGWALPGGVFGYALALVALYMVPGDLLLRVLLGPERRAGLHPLQLTAISVAAGVGGLAVPVLIANQIQRLPFAAVLLIHAVWQAVALAIALRGRDVLAPRASTVDEARWWYALVAVVAAGGVVVAFAHFDFTDGFYLGGADKNIHMWQINNIYHDPVDPVYGAAGRIGSGAWAYQQALVARVGGLEPYQVIETHATGPLLLLWLLAFFALAYEVSQCAPVAWLSLIFGAGVALVDAARIGYFEDIPFAFTGRVLLQIAEDKYLNTYVYIMPAVALTLYLLDRAPRAEAAVWWRRLVPWAALAVMLAGIVGTHALGFGQYMLLAGGYAVLSWLRRPRLPGRWTVLALCVVVLLAAAVPLSQLLDVRAMKEVPPLLDWAAVELNYAGAWHVRVGMSGAYILHPWHVGAPVYVVGIGLGLLMAARIGRDRAARYIFAATAAPLVLAYVPYVASTAGNLLRPHTLERLLWLLPLGLAMAYAAWLALDWLARRVSYAPVVRSMRLALPVMAAVLVLLPTYQTAALKLFDRSMRPEWPEYADPQTEAVAGALAPLTTSERRKVLTPYLFHLYLPAVLDDVKPYAYMRWGFFEMRELYANPWWGLDALAVLQDFRPDFFIVENGSPPQTFARLQPGVYTPLYENARYTLYETSGDWVRTPTDQAHTLLAAWTSSLPGAIVARYDLETPPEEPDWPAAARLYRSALDADSEDFRARRGLAFVYAQMGRYGEAVALYREVLGRFPGDGVLRVELAAALHAQGDTGTALAVLLESPDPATLRVLLDEPFLPLLSETQLETALMAWLDYPRYLSGPHPARALAGRLLDFRGDRARAVRVLEHIAPGYRTSGDLRLLGSLYLLAGDRAAAIDAFGQDGGRSAAVSGLYHLARGYAAEDLPAARAAYRASLDAMPGAAAWVMLGRVERGLGNLAAAEAAFEQAAALELPDGFWGEAELVRFYDQAGRVEEADTAYARALESSAVMDVVPFSREDPPTLLPPYGLEGADVPGFGVLLEREVLARSVLPGDGLPMCMTYAAYDLAAGGAWWQVKALHDGDVLAELSAASPMPAGAAARWSLRLVLPAELSVEMPALVDVDLVAVPPEDEAGYFTYRAGQVLAGTLPPLQDVPAVKTDYVFGGRVRLYGYTLEEDGTLALYWETIAPPPPGLKIFVHILTPGQPEPVAQADRLPPYPTGVWGAGARVRSVHTLPLDEVPPGDYRLSVGLYDVVTLDRLGEAVTLAEWTE